MREPEIKVTMREIVEWLECERDEARERAKAEPHKNSNHLWTAYEAEAGFAERTLRFIRGEE